MHLRCLLSRIFIFGMSNGLNLVKLLLRMNNSLILLMLVRQTFVGFQLLKLFLQVLSDQLKLFRFWLLSVLVPNSSNYSESIDEFIKRKTVVLWRFWNIHSFTGTRSVVVLLPKLFIFKNDLFQVFKCNNNWINFTQFTQFEKFYSRNSISITWKVLKEFIINLRLFLIQTEDGFNLWIYFDRWATFI